MSTNRRTNRARALACVAGAALASFGSPVQAFAAAQAAPAAKQQPAPSTAPPVTAEQPPATPPAAGTPAAPAPLPTSAYSYNPEGRRDPFVSLIGRGNDPKTGARPSGAAGLLINEVSVKGIVRDRSGLVAMIQGPDNKTFVVKAGDRLMDGTVKSIVQDAVVFSQDVSDPLSLVKQKEIRKTLRTIEGGRG